MAIPRTAYWPNHGRVRILEYLGNDTFKVLEKRTDLVHVVHRSRLQFTRGR